MTRADLGGSRSRGTREDLSDWDFAVETSDFGSVARDLPTLVEPLAALWGPPGPLSRLHAGPSRPDDGRVPVHRRFAGGQRAGEASKGTLPAIDAHFLQWVWWLATKASVGREGLVEQHWPRLFRRLLEPTGVDTVPDGIEAAFRGLLLRRGELERHYGLEVSRALEGEVRGGIRRRGHDA